MENFIHKDDNIKAKVIGKSMDNKGNEIVTYLLQMPKFILAEFNTHRMLSRNSSSSRAIPGKKLLDQPHFIPQHIYKNQSGMAGSKYLDEKDIKKCQELLENHYKKTAKLVENLIELGVHKQTANRPLDYFTYTQTITTATDWKNFFNLRDSKDAQPEIRELAQKMKEAYKNKERKFIRKGEIYIPEVGNLEGICKTDLVKVVTARCARVSYLLDEDKKFTAEQDIALHDKLLQNGHLSPLEHIAQSKENKKYYANLKGFESYRTLRKKGNTEFHIKN